MTYPVAFIGHVDNIRPDNVVLVEHVCSFCLLFLCHIFPLQKHGSGTCTQTRETGPVTFFKLFSCSSQVGVKEPVPSEPRLLSGTRLEHLRHRLELGIRIVCQVEGHSLNDSGLLR